MLLTRLFTIQKELTVQDSPILTIEAIQNFNVRYYAGLIENVCDEKLLPPPAGIYMSGTLEPVMTDGNNYYCNNGIETTLVTDINVVTKSIYDENGNCVIPASIMRNKARLVGNESFLPYRGIKIINLLVQDQIDSFSSYKKTREVVYGKIAKHFINPSDEDSVLGAVIEHIYSELAKEIAIFLEDKSWNIYFIKSKNELVTIERGLDYRAYCWEMEHGESFRNGKYKSPN